MATANVPPVDTRFKKGQSGNPAGRPKHILTAALRGTITDADMTAMAKKLIDRAKKGDLHAMAMVWDRLEGRPVQRNENSGPDGGPQEFEHKFEQLSDDQIVDVLKAAVAK
jgi:hypothetical protein